MKDKMNFKSKTKRVVALALVVVLCLAMVPIASFAQEEVTVCPYCDQKLNGEYDCTLVTDGYYSDELDCGGHFPQNECDACAEFDALQRMLCDEKYDIIVVEVDGDDGVEYETTEIAHEHEPDCYVECDGNCDGGHICVVECSQEHEEHSEECYLWVDAVCEHSEILPKPQIDEDAVEGLEDEELTEISVVQTGKTMSFAIASGQLEEESTYIVTFEDINGNVLKTVSVNAENVIPENDIPTLNPAPEHWHLIGAAGPAAEAFDFAAVVTDNITLRPYYNENKDTVSVTFIVEGIEYLIQTPAVNGSATEPLPPTIPSGYLSFLGWYNESTGELFDFSTPITESVVLVAEFSNQYLIKFKNHEDVVVYTMLVSPNSQVIYPADLSEIGIESEISNGSFKYWYDEASAAPSDGVFVSGTYATKNLTLKPYYNNEYLLIFISDGTQVEAQAVQVGTATVAPQAPTRAGYTFDKWVYYATGEAFAFGSTISKDTVLRATWTPIQTDYTIIYWCEKADIDGDPGENTENYGFYKAVTKKTLSGTAISSLDISAGTLDPITVNGIKAFNYRHLKCATETVLGNGLTVVNVYFRRIVYTYNFNLNPGTTTTTARYGATMTFNGTTYSQGVDPDGNNYANNQYSFEAKYEQDIENVWPSSWNAAFAKTSRSKTGASWGTVSTTKFASWIPSNITATSSFVTKRFTITEDMLPKSGTSVTFSANWGSVTTRQVNYWFEKLLSESTEGAQSRSFSGVTARYYVMSSYYSQSVDLTSTLSAKEYTGMIYVGAANTPASGTATTYNFYYTRNRYVLNFDTRGGVAGAPAGYDCGAVMYGEALSLYMPANPTKTGENGVQYKFLGWYYDTDYKIPVDFSKDTMPNSSLTLFARWESTEYTVSYYDGIGGTLLYSQGRAFGEYADLNEISELQGYTVGSSVEGKGVFNGWLWKVSGIYTEYSFDMPVSKSIDLYASWLVDGLTITYDADGGDGAVPKDTDEYKYGISTMVLNGSGFIKGNQVFIGWQVDGEGRVYYPGNMLKITGNMRLVAVYASASDFITIIYHSNNGEDHKYHVNILKADSEYEAAGAIFSKTDSALIGWNTLGDGSGTAYGLGETLSVADITENLAGSTLNLYAQWEESPRYNVTYAQSFSGGTPDDPTPFAGFVIENSDTYRKNDATVPFMNELTYTEVIGTSDGVHGVFKFTGWTSEPVGVQISEDGKTLLMPDSDVKFIANWTFTPTYAVTYQWASAYAAAVEESYTLNQQVTRYIADADVIFLGSESYPEINNVISNGRNGKLVFTGWTDSITDSDISVAFTDGSGLFKMSAEDVVFTGHWEFVADVVTLAVTKKFDGITDESLISQDFKIIISYKDAYSGSANELLKIASATPSVENNHIAYSWIIEDFPANTAFMVTEYDDEIAGYTHSAAASFLSAALIGSSSWPVDGIKLSEEEGLTNTFAITNTYKKYTVSYQWADGTILPAGFSDASLPASEERAGGTKNIRVAGGYDNVEVLGGNNNPLAVWTFNGWVLDESSETVVTDGLFTMPNDNVVFKGSWTLKNIADLGVAGYNGAFTGQSRTVTVDKSTLINGDVLQYSLTGKDDWSETPPEFTDVTRDAGGNLAAIGVYVRAVNEKLGTARTVYTSINISKRNITLTADSERYTYNGNIREVTTYTHSGDGIADTEILSASAYGSGRGRSGATVSYDVTFAGAITVTKANGSPSTDNYNISTVDGRLTVWDTTTTPPSPSESISPSESQGESESLPPSESQGESESLPPSESQGESESPPPSESQGESPSTDPVESPEETPPLVTIRRPGTPDVYPEPAREGSTLVEWEDGILIEISDEGVPLGNWAYEHEEEVWIFEPEIPLGYAPVTGDSSNLTLALFLFIAAFFALACVFVVKITTVRKAKR